MYTPRQTFVALASGSINLGSRTLLSKSVLRPLVYRPQITQKALLSPISQSFSTSAIRRQKEETQPPVKSNTDGKVVVDLSEHPIIKRIPKFLHPYTIGFLNAPVSHVTSFIIVHELTAVIPLFGLWGLFYYYDYTPVAGIPEWLLQKGTHFIDVLAERNGWTSLKTEAGANIVLQGAISYAIVKAILPFRAAFSLLAMPWFAKWVVIPFTRLFTRIGSKKAAASVEQSASRKPGTKFVESTITSSFRKQMKETSTPLPDPRGQVWTQDLPSQPPKIKRASSNKPKL
ncbi:uncharacterized protein SAPINGB_P004985 [Magnusiomyces paraingens]|uniref:Uncharacterized protein n=1 Tax=Magnusiomyces paraingens TaxID=2606893 RepID=A0A5E8C2Z5_9ASCO|nr:uncharacterized protein SAPINGB_P004985 [Saprochaete ingens]VVT56341.1 unnamed protein product [Saprochaete ingens]